MNGTQSTERFWFIEFPSGEARLRCWFQRRNRTIERITVQLEIRYAARWLAVARYDNAHGFCHRDDLHPDGSQDKTRVFIGDVNETFTYAIDELRANWQSFRDRYLGR